MLALVENIKTSTQLRWNRVHKFKCKIDIRVQMGPYVIKTAETKEELMDSFKLRHEVFNVEFRGENSSGLDFDRFDYHFDHLIIVHMETNQIIGTYRLNSSLFSDESYTALEFNIANLISRFDSYLELGRACIHKDFRKGSVITLLWRGIAEYMNKSNAQMLFGCSSVKINNARDAALVYNYLKKQGHCTNEYGCHTTPSFTMKNFDAWDQFFKNDLSEQQAQEAEAMVPALLKSYIKQGAKVVCAPAFDKDFDCIDFLTVLRTSDLANSLAERLRVVR